MGSLESTWIDSTSVPFLGDSLEVNRLFDLAGVGRYKITHATPGERATLRITTPPFLASTLTSLPSTSPVHP